MRILDTRAALGGVIAALYTYLTVPRKRFNP